MAIAPDFRPRLRNGLSVGLDERGRHCLWDPHRIGGPPIPITPLLLEAAKGMTGQWTLLELQTALSMRIGIVAIDDLIRFTTSLDDALFLDGDSLRNYVTGPVRRPSCIGCYPPDPEGIKQTVHRLFTQTGGPGLPDWSARPSNSLRAVLLPHMDYTRGNITYGWGFKELLERTTASLFVIVATSHYSSHRYTLTRMNFQTPLGIVETDRDYVDRIALHYGNEAELFADPVAHLPEHSIELEVVILQAMLAGRRPFRIVPLLCGSFHDAVRQSRQPRDLPNVGRMIAALRAAEREAGEEVVYLISGDLAHIGPKFDDTVPVDRDWLMRSKTADEQLLDRLKAADADGYFQSIANERDERRICGLPPTYLALEVVQPTCGRILHYQQFADPSGYESVSFASAAFE